jgi:hypothetical protein
MRLASFAAFALAAAFAAAGHAQPPVPVLFPDTELGRVQSRCFYVCFGPACNGGGAVEEIDVAPPFHVRGVRLANAVGGQPCDPARSLTMANLTLPRHVGAGQALVFDIDAVPVSDGHWKSLLGVNGENHFELAIDVDPVFVCTPDARTHCLEGDRFKVETFWRKFNGENDAGRIVPGAADDSGLFYFFQQENWEQLVKVLNGCGTNQRYWIFAASTTNLEFNLSVVDTKTQATKTYFAPMGPPAPAVTDTLAFATCP